MCVGADQLVQELGKVKGSTRGGVKSRGQPLLMAGHLPTPVGCWLQVNHELAWIDRVKRAGDYQPGQWTERRQQLFR